MMGFLNNSHFYLCQTQRKINTTAAHLTSSGHAQGLQGSQEHWTALFHETHGEKSSKATQTPETKGGDSKVAHSLPMATGLGKPGWCHQWGNGTPRAWETNLVAGSRGSSPDAEERVINGEELILPVLVRQPAAASDKEVYVECYQAATQIMPQLILPPHAFPLPF